MWCVYAIEGVATFSLSLAYECVSAYNVRRRYAHDLKKRRNERNGTADRARGEEGRKYVFGSLDCFRSRKCISITARGKKEREKSFSPQTRRKKGADCTERNNHMRGEGEGEGLRVKMAVKTYSSTRSP